MPDVNTSISPGNANVECNKCVMCERFTFQQVHLCGKGGFINSISLTVPHAT